jgi:LysM repeat protein
MRIGLNLFGSLGAALLFVSAAAFAQSTPPGTARALMQANEQKLNLTLNAPTSPVVVREGETLQTVAMRLNTSVTVLAQLNNLTRPFTVKPGQVLLAPAQSVRAMLSAPVLPASKQPLRTAVAAPKAEKKSTLAAQPRAPSRNVQTASAANRNRPLPPGVSDLDLLPLSKRPGASDPVPAAPVARAKVEAETLR